MNHDRLVKWLRAALAFSCFLCLVGMAGRPAHAEPGELTIAAAAADLNFAFKELIKDFEAQTGERVKLISGSSGHFYAQVANAAPFDLYFSADISYPKKLIAEGLGVADSLYQMPLAALSCAYPMAPSWM